MSIDREYTQEEHAAMLAAANEDRAALLGEAERIAVNLKKRGQYLAANVMRMLAAIANGQGEDARDAARYRRIRNGPHSDRHGDVYAMTFQPDGDEPIHGEALDICVDAAMSASKEPK